MKSLCANHTLSSKHETITLLFQIDLLLRKSYFLTFHNNLFAQDHLRIRISRLIGMNHRSYSVEKTVSSHCVDVKRERVDLQAAIEFLSRY